MNTTNDASSAPKILIVGGYGSVGYRIAKLLAPDFRARITIAGRNLRKAEDLARTLGHDSQARMIDVNDSRSYTAALEDVGLVIMCLDLTDTAFARACVTRGIHYVGITASLEVIERLSLLHDLAAANNAALVLSVGLTPGLTNLLAKACVGDAAKSLQVIDIHLFKVLYQRKIERRADSAFFHIRQAVGVASELWAVAFNFFTQKIFL